MPVVWKKLPLGYSEDFLDRMGKWLVPRVRERPLQAREHFRVGGIEADAQSCGRWSTAAVPLEFSAGSLC